MVKSIEEFKIKIQGAIKIFGSTMVAALILTEVSFLFQVHTWIVGITPTVMILSFIGLYTAARTLLYLTSCEKEVAKIDEEDLIVKFIGVDSVMMCFWFVFPAVFVLVFSIYSIKGINMLTMSSNPLWLGLIIAFVLFIVLKRLIEELSVNLFYIGIIRSLTKEINGVSISERKRTLYDLLIKPIKHK